LEVEIRSKVGVVKHQVTHHAITLHGFEACTADPAPEPKDCETFAWANLEELSNLPVAAPQAVLVAAIRRETSKADPSLRSG
jgi:adenine-specific DNA glycosylase